MNMTNRQSDNLMINLRNPGCPPKINQTVRCSTMSASQRNGSARKEHVMLKTVLGTVTKRRNAKAGHSSGLTPSASWGKNPRFGYVLNCFFDIHYKQLHLKMVLDNDNSQFRQRKKPYLAQEHAELVAEKTGRASSSSPYRIVQDMFSLLENLFSCFKLRYINLFLILALIDNKFGLRFRGILCQVEQTTCLGPVHGKTSTRYLVACPL